VQVNGSNLNLNTTDGTVSTVIDHSFIDNMPLNGRSLDTLFELTPGVVQSSLTSGSNHPGTYVVNGQRATSNQVSVDGASANIGVDPAYGQNLGGNTIPTSASGGTNGVLPVDAIEEYRIDTSTYSAEFGRTPGGQIQVKSRGGTNDFHGSVYE